MLGTGRRLVAIGALIVGMAIAGSSTLPASAASPSPSPSGFVRGVYGKDSSSTGFKLMAANGFNAVMVGPYRELIDPLAAQGLKGVVWLGDFINAPTCAFARDDATVTRLVQPLVGDRSIVAYYLGDEPHVTQCANAPALFKKRSALVHALDPGSKTFTVIQASENGVSHDYAPWVGAVDIIGFDVYPCSRSATSCNFGLIDEAVAAIHAVGVTDFWAIPQDFQDCYYRLPTDQELAQQFDHWAGSGMSGYFVFSWNYQPANRACVGVSLERHPDNVAQLKTENARSFVGSSAPRAPSGGGAPGRPPLLWLFAGGLLLAALLAGAAATAVRLRSGGRGAAR